MTATIPKCAPDLTTRCDALEKVMLTEANGRKAGVSLWVVTNIDTDVSRIIGVAARASGKEKAIMFNYCPYCGVGIAQTEGVSG